MGNLLNIAQKRRLAILAFRTWVEFPFNGGTEADLSIETVDGSDWEVDWGDGIVETYPSSAAVVNKNYGSSFTGTVRIKGDVSYLRSEKGSFDWTNVSQLTSLTNLYLNSNLFTGNMSGVSGLTSLTNLYLNSNLFTGNMSGVSGLTSLTILYLQSTQFTGDMSGVIDLTSLTYLRLQSTQFTGDMSGVIDLTSLTRLYLYSTQFTGDMSGVSSLTLLVYLYLNGNSFTGDMTGVSSLTLLEQLYLISNQFTYTYSSLSADFRNFHIRLQPGELSNPTDIDSILIDIDNNATSGSGSIDLRSTGAASPTAASASAVSSLTNKGRTVLTN